jgi:hypothetical protein
MTKALTVVLVHALVLAIGAECAVAQGRAWCLNRGSSTSCSYYTYEQCMESRVGSSTYCTQNPDFSGSGSDRRRR